MASATVTTPSIETAPSRQQGLTIVPRVLLADDQHEILEVVNSILSADEFTVVGTAADGMDAVELAMNLMPDVVVLDISMPVVNGIEAACQIKKEAPDIRIVFLTVHTDPEFVEAALAVGAAGYVLKGFIAAELVPALRAALHDEIFVSPEVPWP